MTLPSKVCAQLEVKLHPNVTQVSSIYCGENKKKGQIYQTFMAENLLAKKRGVHPGGGGGGGTR